MSSENPKRRVFAQFAAVARALGHEHRLELVEHLAQGERSVEALSERIGLSIANTSQHLQHLRRAGIVTSRRDGKYVVYSLADDAVIDLTTSLRRVAERNIAEVDRLVSRYFHECDSLEPVSTAKLLERLQEGSVMLLDVRPEDEFAQGHLPGALNIPLSELEARLPEIGHEREIVAYCRGPYCILSFQAVAELRRQGFCVRRLEEGFPEWKAAGLPVETSVSAAL